MQRSASFDVGRDFAVDGEITKSYQRPDGTRVFRGVASGVLEDRDGERVSARAIAEMAATPTAGLKLVAAVHKQDWTNEIGNVTALEVDPETDEMIAEAELPPVGTDALADKAWREHTTGGKKFGFSIGGKLNSAFFELADRGGQVVKRKVLDSITLKHLVLTDTPSYRTAFCEAVGKTVGDVVADDSLAMFDEPAGTEQADAVAALRAVVAKAAKPPPEEEATPTDASEDAAAGPADGQAPPDDSAAAPPAGAGDQSDPAAAAAAQPAADPNAAPSDAEQTQGLPLSSRHLACPNCGEEFAAPLPDDQTPDPAEQPPPPTETGKTHTPQETTMDPKALMAELRELLAEKTTGEEPKGTEAVAKTKTTEASEFEQLLAASHGHNAERLDSIEKNTTEALEIVAKAVSKIREHLEALPQGRRSAAAFAPGKPQVEVNKTATEDEVQKTAEDLAEGGDLLGALKTLNEAHYGIR